MCTFMSFSMLSETTVDPLIFLGEEKNESEKHIIL